MNAARIAARPEQRAIIRREPVQTVHNEARQMWLVGNTAKLMFQQKQASERPHADGILPVGSSISCVRVIGTGFVYLLRHQFSQNSKIKGSRTKTLL